MRSSHDICSPFGGLAFVLFLLCSGISYGQNLEKAGRLPENLQEISGLAFLNDSVLVAHNDSGNEPLLYFLDLQGKFLHKVWVRNVENRDWEDITTDRKGNLYIGNIGNNANTYRKLYIYKIDTENILSKEEVFPETIEFSYPEQKDFPPAPADRAFDAEALAWHDDSLYIFTKCNTDPFDGVSHCYVVPATPGNYTAVRRTDFFIGKKGFYLDAVTGAEICGEYCYLLTYNRMLVYKMKNGRICDGGLEFRRSIHLRPYSQKEALVTQDNRTFYFGDEYQRLLGGGKLYKMKL